MPPRTRRPEAPARRDARIRKHIAQAREYWTKAPAYLAEGDLCQASEKGLGRRRPADQSRGYSPQLGTLRPCGDTRRNQGVARRNAGTRRSN